MRPRGPNEKIIAMAVVNGGEIRGRRQAASRTVPQAFERLARTAVKAKKNPRAVPATPTSAASNRLFQNDWRWFGSLRMVSRFARVSVPPSVNVRKSSHTSGYKTNRPSRTQRITTLVRSVGSWNRRRTVWALLAGVWFTRAHLLQPRDRRRPAGPAARSFYCAG